MVKYIFLCARRKNVLPVIYIVMSNHAHVAILSENQQVSDAFVKELKRCYSLYFSLRYREKKVLARTHAFVQQLDSDPYVRNVLAYIPRNALDAGVRIEDYRWSGYRAMFRSGQEYASTGATKNRAVRNLSRRQCFDLMHTRDDLREVSWMLDPDGCIEPSSACDTAYLESAFLGDQAFFLKTIGSVNPSEMRHRLEDVFSGRLTDSEFYKEVNTLCQRWFQKELSLLYAPDDHPPARPLFFAPPGFHCEVSGEEALIARHTASLKSNKFSCCCTRCVFLHRIWYANRSRRPLRCTRCVYFSSHLVREIALQPPPAC